MRRCITTPRYRPAVDCRASKEIACRAEREVSVRGKILTVMVTLCCLTIPEAVGRCRFAPYVLTGQVTEHGTGRGIAEAKIFVFLDRPKRGEADWACSGDHPDWVLTTSQGKFEVQCRFNTTKGYSLFSGHNCSAVPTAVSVFVVSENHHSRRKRFRWKGLKIKQEPSTPTNKMRVELPSIELRSPREEEPLAVFISNPPVLAEKVIRGRVDPNGMLLEAKVQ